MTGSSSDQEPRAAPLVAIIGPTASGKSALATTLAEHLNGEILACDSTQVYRHFDIGTAKPAAEERRRIPHHLVDLLEPEELMTAGEYRKLAIAVLEDLRRRKRLPIFTVGTGLYWRALLEGLADAPTRSEELRARLGQRASVRGSGYLHRLLSRLDRAAAARIAPRDNHKLIRAIEICLLSGKSVTEVHRAGRAPLEGFRPIKIGLNPPREQIRERIVQRTRQMMERGWLMEVDALLARGVPRSASPFSFIGYREILALKERKSLLADATAAIALATQRYAKRQMTWFRKERDVTWIGGFGDEPNVGQAALALVQARLQDRTVNAPAINQHSAMPIRDQ